MRVDARQVDETLEQSWERRGTRPGVVVGIVVLVLLCVLAWRMVPHPLGPARTFEKYQGKAVTTAKGAQSDVATVILSVEAASTGNSFGPYNALVVSDAEEALNGVLGSFDSIQPPDARADALKRELDGLIGQAIDHVTDVRIAARRGVLGDLDTVARPLKRDAVALQAFADANS